LSRSRKKKKEYALEITFIHARSIIRKQAKTEEKEEYSKQEIIFSLLYTFFDYSISRKLSYSD
jgi:hypothetical protein